MRVEVGAEVGLLLGHRFEEQPLLRREVAVDGAERDVGRGRDVAHLHRVEPAVGGEGEGRVEHPAPARRLATGQRALGSSAVGATPKLKHVSISLATHASQVRDAPADGPARHSRTACSPASCRSNRTTRSPSSGQLAEIQPGLAFVDAFANSSAVDTDDGLVVVDTSGVFHAKSVHETMRRWSREPARHRDLHARPHRPRLRRRPLRGGSPDQRVGTAARRSRTSSSRNASTATSLTAGYNAVINQRQFKAPGLRWPIEYRYPDETYRRPTRARRRRRALRAATTPAARPTTRTWVWAPDAQGAVHRRPVHLGVAELRQPAEGAALRARLGARVPQDGRARRPTCCSPVTASRSSAPTACARRSPKAPSCSSRSSSRRSRS